MVFDISGSLETDFCVEIGLVDNSQMFLQDKIKKGGKSLTSFVNENY